MGTVTTILLGLIAYILWRIYRQREDEKTEQYAAKLREKRDAERAIFEKQYPHLIGNVDHTWIELFSKYAEQGLLLKMSFLLYLQDSTKMELSEGSIKWDDLWALSEELLEHLEKYHEGTVEEHELALAAYWQNAATAVGKLIEQSPTIKGEDIDAPPFTNIIEIPNFFPKKEIHPEQEFNFMEPDHSFPRNANGSDHIRAKMKKQGI